MTINYGCKQILIDAAQRGDKAALSQLLRECQPSLRRIASKHCASNADADDAVQETLLAIYRRIGALRTVSSYVAWMTAIVRRECRRLALRTQGQEELPDDDCAVFACYSRSDLRVDLVDALYMLPKNLREIILLRDLEQHSIAEIANALRLSQEAVKSRIHRAHTKVRKRLAG